LSKRAAKKVSEKISMAETYAMKIFTGKQAHTTQGQYFVWLNKNKVIINHYFVTQKKL
jgi:hypothetical protein